jgi:hypothetical protein
MQTEPAIEYSKFDEIERRFNEFCEEYDAKIVTSPTFRKGQAPRLLTTLESGISNTASNNNSLVP